MLKGLDGTEEKYEESPEEDFGDEVLLNTHADVSSMLFGEIEKLADGHSLVRLQTTSIMTTDKSGMIHSGFLFNSADYAAMISINERNVILIGSSTTFFSPVRLGDVVEFEATVRHKEGRKRDISVVGTVEGIKVFKGEFRVVITDTHILNIDLIGIVEKGIGRKIEQDRI
ncbi:MAG: PaaI family thioesterase [Helicobacteraceae bacterium]|nr:PaaI family thioesterase [Helicobacteraceae bacterium]